jgi:putative addiction module killer protein
MFEIRRTDRFDKWLKGLADKKGKALISDRIERLAQGHMGDAKVVGNGVTELRVHFGPPDGHFNFLHLWPGQNPPLDSIMKA